MEMKPVFEQMNTDRLVYVRPVDTADLPADVRDAVKDLDHIFVVHNADGEQLALVKDRKLAFMLARQNDMAPVSVH